MTQVKIEEARQTQQGLEQFLWKAAHILREAVRPERYGTHMLPLLLFKKLSDVWIDEYGQPLEKYKTPETAKQKFLHNFIISDGCLWDGLERWKRLHETRKHSRVFILPEEVWPQFQNVRAEREGNCLDEEKSASVGRSS